MSTRVLVGTVKGGFWLTSQDRQKWQISEPFFKGWKLTAGLQLADGRAMLGVASDIYGPALFVSSHAHLHTEPKSWKQIPDGPAYAEGDKSKLRQIWTLRENRGVIYAGVQDAGIFRSRDGGKSWSGVPGLNEHESRDAWMPGAGGLCCHVILFSNSDPERIWCGISAVGVFRSDDGGTIWEPKNRGVSWSLEDESHKEIGFCVHGLAQDPHDPDRIYRQDHSGMYRSSDGGDNWERNENGLPSGFGFPIVTDSRGKQIFAAPLESDEYRLPVDGSLGIYRSTDSGDSWHRASEGLPAANSYGAVLRGAMAADRRDPVGLYVGTTAGTVHVSQDGGESWINLPVTLPRILHVSVWED